MKLQLITLLFLSTVNEIVGRPPIPNSNTPKLVQDKLKDLNPRSDLKVDDNLIDKNNIKDSLIDHQEGGNVNPGLKNAQEIKLDDELRFEPSVVKDGKKLSLDQLKPVDHVDAVKMEQDGHLNQEYHKELFLGNHEVLEADTDENALKKLIDIFTK